MQFFARFVALTGIGVPFLVQAAPLSVRSSNEVIPGKYIIQLKPDVDSTTIQAHRNQVREIHARNIDRRDISEEEKAVSNTSMTLVLNIEEDTIMYTTALTTQNSAPWGLGSISSRTRGATSYIYDTTAGQDTFNYVIDTGIRIMHNGFGGRATWGFNAVNNNNNDNNGHGTHVAGTIAGSTYGVAKRANVIAVKVFEGREGTTSTVIAGFDWAVNDIVSKGRQNTAVLNLSLGGPGSSTWDNAITAAWNQGVLAVVAAGNENQPASNRSPARSPETITVGNVQENDARRGGSTGSNYGPAVDIFAAGTSVLSAYSTSNSATASLSGTSMASPHVAGLVSYLRALEGPLSASVVKARVLTLATTGRVTDLQGSPNRLAYNGNGR
ncbi:subtilisin-like protease-like protein [Zopfia rhizophila CBS 207.26]|uniref:Subtilisin-like protease-like protein n=1 Tax=Zopfia rhizophila CBS 207.26 TaxID=1314779 RepID=A0A6A6DFF8_9PEZI|nr:subtilisin-like protease-like protein [Zopfia rhizophila CBS 207.26]